MEPAAAHGMRCALCGATADVHCAADAAFLCSACDAQVHGANFLASRHRRKRVSPPKQGRDDEDDDDVSASACSSCLSTADSAATTATAPRRRKPSRRPTRGEAVLRGWAKRMGLTTGTARRRAGRALQDVAAAAPRVPLRVAMAAALWREVAAHGVQGADRDVLRRLEACARVPARLLVEVSSSMGRARVKPPAAVEDENTEEGWGECS